VRHILLSGFGPFERAPVNPSGEIARFLGQTPPAGLEIRSVVLPVTFHGAPAALDEALQAPGPGPELVLALGVQRAGSFRPETRARSRLAGSQADNGGVTADELDLPDAPDLYTLLDSGLISACLARAGAEPVEMSTDAGQFVCERLYRHLLEATRGGSPALFLHVPPVEVMEPVAQAAIVGAFLSHLVRGM
jgi:pyroglutamyl-peptidase